MFEAGIPHERAATPCPGAGATALRRLWLLAAVVVTLTLATSAAFQAGGDTAYMGLAITTGLVAAAATGVAERAPATTALWIVVGVALLLRGILLFVEPLLSSDIYRYIWDGRVLAAGINPYRYVPADPALMPLRDASIYPNINRADYAVTIYPPVAQAFFFLVTRLGETVTTMKLAFLGCEAVTVTVILLLLRRLGRPATRLVAYAWHPLPLWEIANNGHVDALMTALLFLGIWLALGGRPRYGAIAIALGALAKPLAVLALPAVWQHRDWKLPLLVVAVVAACYTPFLSVGWGVVGFLATGYVHEEHLDTGGTVWPLAVWRQVFGATDGDFVAYLAGSALILAAMAILTIGRRHRSIETSLADIGRLLVAFLFLLSPHYPWYFLALTPFVALLGGAPLWVLSVGAVLLQDEAWWGWHVALLTRKSVLYGAFLAACAYEAWRLWRRIPAREIVSDDRVEAR